MVCIIATIVLPERWASDILVKTEDDRREKCAEHHDTLRFALKSFSSLVTERSILRSYPLITMVCLQQIKAAARVSRATKLFSVFSKLTRSLLKRFSQECVRSTTHRLAL